MNIQQLESMEHTLKAYIHNTSKELKAAQEVSNNNEYRENLRLLAITLESSLSRVGLLKRIPSGEEKI